MNEYVIMCEKEWFVWENYNTGKEINSSIVWGINDMKINKITCECKWMKMNERCENESCDSFVRRNDVPDVSGIHAEARWESDWTWLRQRLMLTCVYVTWGSAEVTCPRLRLSGTGASAEMWALFPKPHLTEVLSPSRETHMVTSPINSLYCILVPRPRRILFHTDTPYLQPEFRPAGNESHATEITWWSQMSCRAELLPIMLIIEF